MNKSMYEMYKNIKDLIKDLSYHEKEFDRAEKILIETWTNSVELLEACDPQYKIQYELDFPGIDELEKKLTRRMQQLIFDFQMEFFPHDSELYKKFPYIMINAITACLNEAQYSTINYQPFTSRQADHICYKIREWYLRWESEITNDKGTRHRLGTAKEELKTMICGNGLGL